MCAGQRLSENGLVLDVHGFVLERPVVSLLVAGKLVGTVPVVNSSLFPVCDPLLCIDDVRIDLLKRSNGSANLVINVRFLLFVAVLLGFSLLSH